MKICIKCNYHNNSNDIFLNFPCRKCNYSTELLCKPSSYKTWDGFRIYEIKLRNGWGWVNLLPETLFAIPKYSIRLTLSQFI